MSHLKRVYRPWKTIATELSQEHDSERIVALAEELDAAIVAQRIPQRVQGNSYVRLRDSEWVRKLLDSTLLLTSADFGNVQLFDSKERALKLAAHRGFEHEFLTYFDTVNCDDDCACGAAMNRRSRVVISDVATDPVFGDGESRQVILRANVQSLQSTPLVNSDGDLVGMLSTHFSHCVTPSPAMLKDLDAVVSEFVRTIPAHPTPL